MNIETYKMSRVGKLDGIRSWSLEAGKTCPASFNKDGSLVPACQGCYAKGGNYRFKNVKAPREINRAGWKSETWADDMVKALDSDRYFRWLDSGDIYHPALAAKVLEVMQRTPWVKHWLPTRSYKLAKIRPYLEEMKKLANVSVRYSSDDIDGSFTDGLHGSTILPEGFEVPEGVTMCNAPYNDGKCSGCRACWDKDINVIGYTAHGKSMQKVIRVTLG